MTPEESIKAIDRIIAECKTIVPKVELAAANEMYVVMSNRIFNERRNTSGGRLGKYKSKGWMNKREDAGRQIDERDLNFSGNLAFNFTRGLQNGRWATGFTDNTEKTLDKYSPKGRQKRKSKAKRGKLRPKALAKSKTGARARKPPKPIKYPGASSLSELIEENLDQVIFTPSKKEVTEVLKITNTFAIRELNKIINKNLK